LSLQRYQELSKQRLDRAILIFVQNFRRSYVGDQAMHSSKVRKFKTPLLTVLFWFMPISTLPKFGNIANEWQAFTSLHIPTSSCQDFAQADIPAC